MTIYNLQLCELQLQGRDFAMKRSPTTPLAASLSDIKAYKELSVQPLTTLCLCEDSESDLFMA